MKKKGGFVLFFLNFILLSIKQKGGLDLFPICMLTPKQKYNWFLRTVAIPAVSNTVTDEDQLRMAGAHMFGSKFHGVFMRNEIPKTFGATRPYGIINLDPSTKPGSHWIAVAAQPHPLPFLVYDSLGKLNETPRELTQLYGKQVKTLLSQKREQGLRETNCGARCLAWLLLMECFPHDARKL